MWQRWIKRWPQHLQLMSLMMSTALRQDDYGKYLNSFIYFCIVLIYCIELFGYKTNTLHCKTHFKSIWNLFICYIDQREGCWLKLTWIQHGCGSISIFFSTNLLPTDVISQLMEVRGDNYARLKVVQTQNLHHNQVLICVFL